jgi:hypothetical protein
MSSAPEIGDLRSLADPWSDGELKAFFCCVRSNQRQEPPTSRAEVLQSSMSELFWAYNSRAMAEGKRKAAKAAWIAHSLLPTAIQERAPKPTEPGEPHEYAKPLSYEFLLREACAKLDMKSAHCEPAGHLEIYLYEAIVVRTLSALDPQRRHEFLSKKIELDPAVVNLASGGVAAPMTTLAALSAAQASGFGVYLVLCL